MRIIFNIKQGGGSQRNVAVIVIDRFFAGIIFAGNVWQYIGLKNITLSI